MSRSMGKRGAAKLQRRKEALQIIEFITVHGKARRAELIEHCQISTKSCIDRLKVLQRQGIDGVFIRSIRHGAYGAVWVLGKEERAPTPSPVTSFKLTEFPPALQRLFGLIDFTPPPGRYIKESMPGWINRKNQPHIGSGSCAYLNSMGDM